MPSLIAVLGNAQSLPQSKNDPKQHNDAATNNHQ
jgi:hypothetical protein